MERTRPRLFINDEKPIVPPAQLPPNFLPPYDVKVPFSPTPTPVAPPPPITQRPQPRASTNVFNRIPNAPTPGGTPDFSPAQNFDFGTQEIPTDPFVQKAINIQTQSPALIETPEIKQARERALNAEENALKSNLNLVQKEAELTAAAAIERENIAEKNLNSIANRAVKFEESKELAASQVAAANKGLSEFSFEPVRLFDNQSTLSKILGLIAVGISGGADAVLGRNSDVFGKIQNAINQDNEMQMKKFEVLQRRAELANNAFSRVYEVLGNDVAAMETLKATQYGALADMMEARISKNPDNPRVTKVASELKAQFEQKQLQSLENAQINQQQKVVTQQEFEPLAGGELIESFNREEMNTLELIPGFQEYRNARNLYNEVQLGKISNWPEIEVRGFLAALERSGQATRDAEGNYSALTSQGATFNLPRDISAFITGDVPPEILDLMRDYAEKRVVQAMRQNKKGIDEIKRRVKGKVPVEAVLPQIDYFEALASEID